MKVEDLNREDAYLLNREIRGNGMRKVKAPTIEAVTVDSFTKLDLAVGFFLDEEQLKTFGKLVKLGEDLLPEKEKLSMYRMFQKMVYIQKKFEEIDFEEEEDKFLRENP